MAETIDKRWQRRKQARPAEIAAAALDLFVERGFAATRLEDVAARAGVTKGTLYLYFDNKEALLKQAVTEMMVPNIERVESVLTNATGSSAELLRASTNLFADYIHQPIARLPKLMISEGLNFPDIAKHIYDQLIARVLAVHRQIISRGIERGEFRPVDLDWIAHHIHSQYLLLALWVHAIGPATQATIDPVAYCQNFIELLIEGLNVTPAPAPSPAEDRK
jgi:AcrR family transcriptional regulator